MSLTFGDMQTLFTSDLDTRLVCEDRGLTAHLLHMPRACGSVLEVLSSAKKAVHQRGPWFRFMASD